MGPCMYCKKMIYLDWIAERGYHRDCHEKAMNQAHAFEQHKKDWAAHQIVVAKKEERRRIRRGQIKSQKWKGITA